MRTATPEERAAIVETLAAYAGFDVHDMEYEQIDGSVVDVGILDSYITDCPGYCGPVAVAIFSGGPEMTHTLTKSGHEWRITAPTRAQDAAYDLLSAMCAIRDGYREQNLVKLHDAITAGEAAIARADQASVKHECDCGALWWTEHAIPENCPTCGKAEFR